MQMIAAVSQSWGIGREGGLLFRLPSDLRRFRELTIGRTVIMGRKTLESLPHSRPLPNRRNLVLTRQPNFAPEGVEVVHSVEELLKIADEDAFVIGGETVYRQLLPHCTRAYITRVLSDAQADVFFPDLDKDPAWQVSAADDILTENGLSFQYVEYTRI